MSEVETEIQNLREYQKDQKTLVDARDAAIRLYSQPDFKRLIVDGFMTQECARYVQESCDPLLKPEQRADALNLAQASGHLKRFMSLCISIGNTAANNIQQADEHISYVLENGLPEGNE